MKKGLVMEGGALRGLFTTGVIDVLMEEGITFDGAVGVSAGAAFGCNIKSQQIGRTLRYYTKYCKRPEMGSYRSLFTTGDFYDAKFCYETIPMELDPFDTETFTKNPMAFYCVVTDVNTGKPFYHRCTDGGTQDLKWIRASASMPIVSELIPIDGGLYSDGGTSDSIPLKFMEHKGYDRNLVILTQPEGYVKKPNPYLPLVKLLYRKYPAFIATFANRFHHYNDETAYVAEKEKAGETFVIRPPKALNVHSSEKNPEKLDEVYHMGRSVMREHLEELKQYLQQ